MSKNGRLFLLYLFWGWACATSSFGSSDSPFANPDKFPPKLPPKPSNQTVQPPVQISFKECVPMGVQLLHADGSKGSPEVFEGKYVGVYFSAHWCGPCRSFTPKLQAFRDANKDKFEVLFVSMDIDRKNPSRSGNQAKKEEYMKLANMNWYTIDCNYSVSYKLLRKTGRKGIPTLVVFSPDGKHLTSDGKNDVKYNPATAFEKWKTRNR